MQAAMAEAPLKYTQRVGDAEKRNDYLASFDGGILSSGSHSVLGTCVIRTSTYLKASQQQALEQALIDALTRAN